MHPEIKNWQVQQLRFTAFSHDVVPNLTSEIWRLISNDEPETEESRPREGFRRIATTEDSTILEVVTAPGRLDVVKSSVGMAEIQSSIHFGNAEDQIKIFFTKISKKILDISKISKLHRIAVGIVLVQPADSREEAYKKLGKILAIHLDPLKTRDFLYQINYPEKLEINGTSLELNRLGRWSAMKTQHFVFQIGNNANGDTPQSPSQLSKAQDFVRCEIDNSSSAEWQDELPSDWIQKIFDKLIALAETTVEGETRGVN